MQSFLQNKNLTKYTQHCVPFSFPQPELYAVVSLTKDLRFVFSFFFFHSFYFHLSVYIHTHIQVDNSHRKQPDERFIFILRSFCGYNNISSVGAQYWPEVHLFGAPDFSLLMQQHTNFPFFALFYNCKYANILVATREKQVITLMQNEHTLLLPFFFLMRCILCVYILCLCLSLSLSAHSLARFPLQ